MTYEDFKKKIATKIQNESSLKSIVKKVITWDKGYESEILDEKLNIEGINIKYYKTDSQILQGDALIVEFSDVEGDLEKGSSRFPIQLLYEDCCEKNTSKEEADWEFLYETIRQNYENILGLSQSTVIENIKNFEKMKERLIIRPINYTDHKYELKEAIYRQVGDIALVLYILVSDIRKNGRHDVNSMKVQKEFLSSWNMDGKEEELFDDAMINTYIKYPPRQYTIAQYQANGYSVPDYTVGAYMDLNKDSKNLKYDGIFTTTGETNGAVSFFYPGVPERIAQIVGDDYYVAFTGTSEFHVHGIDESRPIDILRRIKSMNNKMNKNDYDLMTRKLYKYDTKAGKLIMLEL